MATQDEIRAKDIIPHKTSFDSGDGFYGDGDSSFFMEAGKLLELTAQNALVNAVALKTSASTDCNDYYDNGVYKVDTTYTNRPTAMKQNGALVVFSSEARKMQLLFEYPSNLNENTRVWFRNYKSDDGGTWTAWDNFAFKSYVDSKVSNVANNVTGLRNDLVALTQDSVSKKDLASTDCNDYYDNGVYKVDTTYTNRPTAMKQNGVLVVLSYEARKIQLLSEFPSNLNENTRVWFRNYVSAGTWTAWENFVSKSYVDEAEYCSIKYVTGENYQIDFGDYNISLKRTTDVPSHTDNWNIDHIRKGYDTLCPSGTDILGPIQINDVDFIGGVHGHEVTDIIAVTADGAAVTLDSSTNVVCKKLTILMKSRLFDRTNDVHSLDRIMLIEFTRNKIRVSNTYTTIVPLYINHATNGGLFAVRNDILVNAAMNNYVAEQPPTASISNSSQVNTFAVLNTTLGSVTIENIIGHEKSTYFGRFHVFTNETPMRTKVYFDIITWNNGEIIPADRKIAGSFEYRFN
jgi:hypothetical protein